MAKRARVIIPFNYDEGWTGGNYYISNLVSALNAIPSARQPDIYILSHNRASFDFINQTAHYPRLHWISSLLMGDIDGGVFKKLRILSKLLPRFLKKTIAYDAIFPFPIDTKARQNTICWIPDFQEKALPHLFSKEELEYRTNQHLYYIDNFDNILFSSYSAQADFERYYPQANNQKHVMQFAVAKAPSGADHGSVIQRLNLPDRFFYCPNQFWMHKNHNVVIEAVHLLAQEGVAVTVAFSGKELDRRDPAHVDGLKRKVKQLGLAEQILFLGFISKEDQYVLIDSAIALLQPSLFEGWSTVVEEAKSKSQYMIASDIQVHREQIVENVTFFDPKSPRDLANAIKGRLKNRAPKVTIDYDDHRRKFAETFMSIITSVSGRDNAR